MYTIEELAQESGFTRWQIHRLRKRRRVGRAVLSPPVRRPHPTDARVWSDLHLRELRQIRRVRDANRTLDDLVDILHPEPEEIDA